MMTMSWERIAVVVASVLVSLYILWGVGSFTFSLVSAVNNNGARITNIERAMIQNAQNAQRVPAVVPSQ